MTYSSTSDLYFSSTISVQLQAIQTRIREGTVDAGEIAKAFRTMSAVCDAFGVSPSKYGHGFLNNLINSQVDTHLNIDKTVGYINENVNLVLQVPSLPSIVTGAYILSTASELR